LCEWLRVVWTVLPLSGGCGTAFAEKVAVTSGRLKNIGWFIAHRRALNTDQLSIHQSNQTGITEIEGRACTHSLSNNIQEVLPARAFAVIRVAARTRRHALTRAKIALTLIYLCDCWRSPDQFHSLWTRRTRARFFCKQIQEQPKFRDFFSPVNFCSRHTRGLLFSLIERAGDVIKNLHLFYDKVATGIKFSHLSRRADVKCRRDSLFNVWW